MICVNHYVDTPACQFLFCKLCIGGRYSHNRRMVIHLTETLAELLDVHTVFVLGVDHNTICTSSNVSMATLQSIIHRLSGNQALTTRDNHKIASNLSLLTCTNLCAETFNGILSLDGISTKQRVLLQPNLIFNNNGTYPQTLQGTNCEYKMLCLSTSITIVDDGFCSHFQRVTEVMQASCEVNCFNIRFTLTGRICQRTCPHTIKFTNFIANLNLGVLNDKTSEATVRLHDADHSFG